MARYPVLPSEAQEGAQGALDTVRAEGDQGLLEGQPRLRPERPVLAEHALGHDGTRRRPAILLVDLIGQFIETALQATHGTAEAATGGGLCHPAAGAPKRLAEIDAARHARRRRLCWDGADGAARTVAVEVVDEGELLLGHVVAAGQAGRHPDAVPGES